MHAIELNLGCEAKVASLHVYNNIANTLPAQFKIDLSTTVTMSQVQKEINKMTYQLS